MERRVSITWEGGESEIRAIRKRGFVVAAQWIARGSERRGWEGGYCEIGGWGMRGMRGSVRKWSFSIIAMRHRLPWVNF